jgi:hypothetical protein
VNAGTRGEVLGPVVFAEGYFWHEIDWEGVSQDGFSAILALADLDNPFYIEIPATPSLRSPGEDSPPGEVIIDSTPKFRWAADDDVDEFALYISEAPYGPGNLVHEEYGIDGDSSSFTLPQSDALTYGTLYAWNMQSKKGTAWSDFSDELYFEVGVPAPTLGSPGEEEQPGEQVADTTPTFQWSGSEDGQKFGLYISEFPYGVSNVVFETENIDGAETDFTLPDDEALTLGTRYAWDMRVFIEGVWSSHSENLYFEIITPLPTAPSNLNAEPGDGVVTITWSDNADNEDGFRVERRVDGGSWSEIATPGQNEESYTDNGVTNGTTYDYRVRAFGNGGESSYSNIDSATPMEEDSPSTPPPPEHTGS